MGHVSKFAFVILGVALAVAVPLAAQTKNAATVAHPLTVEDVIKMSKAGLSEDIVIQQLKKKNQTFDLSTEQLVQLKTASVSDHVISVMMDPSASPAPAVAPTGAASSALASGDPSLPNETGIYAKKQGAWTEVLPEVVNWKTGGVLKSMATAGVLKGDINGHLTGSSSRNSYTSPIEFLIVAPEGVSVTEYQLLRLRKNQDNREFRTVTGGVMHVAGGATRDVVPFESKKLAPRTFSVIFPANLGAGEYGFLPPGAVASSSAASAGKLYSFHIIE